MSQRWRPLLERLGLQPEPSHHHHHHHQTTSESLPLYTSLTDSEPSTPSSSTTTLPNPPSSPSPPPPPPPPTTKSKTTLTRFLTDFTLGFADGLTVPFALTAGLSSLGHTDTVIYAGMAEICAGSISMGIGGYLAARGEVAAARQAAVDEGDGRGGGGGGDDDEKGCVEEEEDGLEGVVARYLGPLELPFHLQAMVVQHVRGCAGVEEALVELESEQQRNGEEGEKLPSPVVAGLSVALGYLLGGMLPLFPYFLVSEVQDGLVWSFVTCAVALFVFGFGKDLALDVSRRRERSAKGGSLGDEGRVRVRWSDVRRSSWEGAQMVILGSVAAAAAVLCVRAFEGFRVDQAAQGQTG